MVLRMQRGEQRVKTRRRKAKVEGNHGARRLPASLPSLVLPHHTVMSFAPLPLCGLLGVRFGAAGLLLLLFPREGTGDRS